MSNQDILAGLITYSLQEIIKKYENPETEVNRVLFEALKRSEATWNAIRINGLETYGLTYDQFCKQCEEKPNILFLSDDELNTYCKALEIMKSIKNILG